ncbi:MAG: TerB family tellurite resistance protein [Thermodesulfobacteriota bacterium]
MLDLFKSIFDKNVDKKLLKGSIDQQQKLKIATCVTLLEAVTSDDMLSDQELHKIIELLKSKYEMTDTQVNELIETSKREREDSADLWYFTNLINENLTIDEKYDLMVMIWEAIYSDGTLDKYENYIAHKLRNLLNLDHTKFIDIKLKVKEGMLK